MSAFTLACRNLLHQWIRTLISLAGVAFALLLISGEYLNLNPPKGFPRLRLSQAEAVAGVESVRPFSVCLGLWRGPWPHSSPRVDPRRWNILILGARPDELHLVFKNSGQSV